MALSVRMKFSVNSLSPTCSGTLFNTQIKKKILFNSVIHILMSKAHLSFIILATTNAFKVTVHIVLKLVL